MTSLIFKDSDDDRTELLCTEVDELVPRVGDLVHLSSRIVGRTVGCVRWVYLHSGALHHISVEFEP